MWGAGVGLRISTHWPVFSSIWKPSGLGKTFAWSMPLWGHQLQITCGGLLVEKRGEG